MTQELVVTAVGPDRRGIVADFTAHVYAVGANLANTRMVNLRGLFAFVALVEGASEILDRLKARLRESAPRLGLTYEFAQAPQAPPAEGIPYRLKTYSLDQRGIVSGISGFLHEQGINIEELETELESSPFDGTLLFTMEIVLLIPHAVNMKSLRSALHLMGDTLNCDIVLERA